MNLTVQKPSFNLADLPVRDLDRQLARQLLHYETRLHTNASAEQLQALPAGGTRRAARGHLDLPPGVQVRRAAEGRRGVIPAVRSSPYRRSGGRPD